MFGKKLAPEMWAKISSLYDNFMMTANGTNFLSCLSNRGFASEASSFLLNCVLEDPILQHRFFIRQKCLEVVQKTSKMKERDGEHVPSLAECVQVDDPLVEKFLKKCEEATELILALGHVCGGAPARGTELATYQFVNSARANRSFFVGQGRVLLLASYNKKEWRQSWARLSGVRWILKLHD